MLNGYGYLAGSVMSSVKPCIEHRVYFKKEFVKCLMDIEYDHYYFCKVEEGVTLTYPKHI